jgi:hypothetical protein
MGANDISQMVKPASRHSYYSFCPGRTNGFSTELREMRAGNPELDSISAHLVKVGVSFPVP